jgi:hypothetical protein
MNIHLDAKPWSRGVQFQLTWGTLTCEMHNVAGGTPFCQSVPGRASIRKDAAQNLSNASISGCIGSWPQRLAASVC